MKTIAQIKNLKVTFNGLGTYFVAFHFEEGEAQCLLATSSKRRAVNCYNGQAKSSGYIK